MNVLASFNFPVDLSIPLFAIHVGEIAPLGSNGVLSAINKHPIKDRVLISRLGLAGDQQADHQHHGGIDKAIHHYPADHYVKFRSEFPTHAYFFKVGGFGENISTQGWIEAEVCLGDLFRLGTAQVEISQGRQPCRKLNLRFGLSDLVQHVFVNGRTGWYYRVREEGDVGPGDTLTLLARPYPEWPLTRLWQTLFGAEINVSALSTLTNLSCLSKNWRERAARRLVT